MNSEEQRIFAHPILDEVLYGYKIDDFEAELGASLEDARNIGVHVDKCRELSQLPALDRRFLRNGTVPTLRELEDGVHEFQTRTGFERSAAQWMIEFLNAGLTAE